MTELEQTLLQALRALESEHTTAHERIEHQQRQIDQLTQSVTEQATSLAQLAKSVNDCLDTLKSSSRQR